MTDPATTALREDFESMYEKYMLHHPAEIRARLKQVVDRRSTVLVRESGTENDAVTAALALGATSFWIDVPRDETLTQHLQVAERLRFESAIDRVGVRFSTGPARMGTFEGLPALEVDLPDKLIHLQRREYVRREPLSSVECSLKLPRVDGENLGAQDVRGRVADIGGGGLAILTTDNDVLHPRVGDELRDVVLELPDDGLLKVRLLVKHVQQFDRDGHRTVRAGCQFIGLNAQDQARLVRYVMQLDRQHSARKLDRL